MPGADLGAAAGVSHSSVETSLIPRGRLHPFFVLMAPAQSCFARYADELVHGGFRDEDKLWARTQSTDSRLAALLGKLSPKAKLDQSIVEKLRAAYVGMRKGAGNGGNRGHRSQSSAPTPPRQQRRGGGIPLLSELTLVDADTTIFDEDHTM